MAIARSAAAIAQAIRTMMMTATMPATAAALHEAEKMTRRAIRVHTTRTFIHLPNYNSGFCVKRVIWNQFHVQNHYKQQSRCRWIRLIRTKRACLSMPNHDDTPLILTLSVIRLLSGSFALIPVTLSTLDEWVGEWVNWISFIWIFSWARLVLRRVPWPQRST